jgi:hypothetical protein
VLKKGVKVKSELSGVKQEKSSVFAPGKVINLTWYVLLFGWDISRTWLSCIWALDHLLSLFLYQAAGIYTLSSPVELPLRKFRFVSSEAFLFWMSLDPICFLYRPRGHYYTLLFLYGTICLCTPSDFILHPFKTSTPYWELCIQDPASRWSGSMPHFNGQMLLLTLQELWHRWDSTYQRKKIRHDKVIITGSPAIYSPVQIQFVVHGAVVLC